MNLLNFLIQSNIFISVAAVFLTFATQVQLGMKPQFHPYLFIIFFATMFEYNLHRLVTIVIKREALEGPKHKWVKDNLIVFKCLVVFSVVGFLLSISLAKSVVLISLAPIAVITVFYSFPLFQKSGFIFRLREIPWLKIFLIAFVWAAVTIFLPVIHAGKHDKWHIVLMFLERVLFIIAITLPFDIRDMEVDIKAGLKTIPVLVGEKMAIKLSNISLLLFLFLAIGHYSADMAFILPAFILSVLSTYYFINSSSIKMSKNYYTGILDGTMLIQGVLICLCYYLLVGV